MSGPQACLFKTCVLIKLIICLAVLGLCCAGVSLAAASGGYTPVAVSGLLVAGASLLVEHGL